MKKEFKKLVSRIEEGIKTRGFFFVLYKKMNLITGASPAHPAARQRTISDFASLHGWKVTDARNVDAFLFLPASSRKARCENSDDLLSGLELEDETLGRFGSKKRSASLMRSACAAGH